MTQYLEVSLDGLGDVVAALEQGGVYVEPGLSGTNGDTVVYIQGFLHSDDHVVIVMMGQSSMSDDAIAQEILGSLSGKTVLGLYVNGHTTAYSNWLPTNVVNKTMKDAQSVSSMTPQETLTTYVRLIHQYQVAHPEVFETTTSTETAADQSTSYVPVAVGGGGLFIAAAAIFAIVSSRRRKKKTSGGQQALSFAPSAVRGQLLRIQKLEASIRNSSMKDKLDTVISDIEEFFKRSTRSRGRNTDQEAIVFEQRLNDVVTLLERYIDIQENPRYYDEPAKLLESALGSIDVLGTHVLQSIKDQNSQRVLEFRVSNELLTTQRSTLH